MKTRTETTTTASGYLVNIVDCPHCSRPTNLKFKTNKTIIIACCQEHAQIIFDNRKH
jgi:hypothetical protein